MVREGYGTSGEGNGTVVGHPKMGAGEVLPLLARDPNYSSVPGSDAEPRLSDAGSGNDGPKKAARGRASVHGEVLLANKTLKKKPYKSLGWSLIAVRPSEPAPFSWLFSRTRRHRANPEPWVQTARSNETPTFFFVERLDAERARPRERRAPPRLRTNRRALERRFRRAPRHPTPLPTRLPPCPRLTLPLLVFSLFGSSSIASDSQTSQAAASGILVACMVAAAVVPFSSVGPAHAVDADTATTFNEHMGFDDEIAVAAVGKGRLAATSDDVFEPLSPAAFAAAVEAKGGKVASGASASKASKKQASWPTPLVVVPAVYDEWDAPAGSETSAIPDWAAPSATAPYAVSALYQRRDEDGENFVPNRAYETGVFLKFVIDHYDDLPEVTAFVSGDFTKDAGGDAAARAALETVAEAVSVSELGKKDASSSSTSVSVSSRKASAGDKRDRSTNANAPAIASYQPLIVDPETFLQSRSPGELVQMWKEQRWGWEDIMGDSAGAAAAHLSRCWRAVAETFGADPEAASSSSSEETSSAASSSSSKKHHAKKEKEASLGASFFFASSSASSKAVAQQGDAKAAVAAEIVSDADRDELAKPPVTVSLYPGAHFAVTRDALLRLPKKTWEKAYEQLVENGSCVKETKEAPRDEIRDKFDLGVTLEFMSHVVFGGASLDAGADARCCGASCVLEDPSCAELGDLKKDQNADAYDVAAIGGPRFDLDAKRMSHVERVISRYNGWNLKELRLERLAASSDAAAVGENEATDPESDVDAVDDAETPFSDVQEDETSPGMDVDVDPSAVETALEEEDAAMAAADAELEAALEAEDEDESTLGKIAYVTADLGSALEQYQPEDWGDARKTLRTAEMKWQGLIDAEKTKVGTLGLETADATSTKPSAATNVPVDVENMDGSTPDEEDLKRLLKAYVDQTDAQIAEISALKEENARLREARSAEASSDVVDLGADEASRSLAARASSMDKQTLVTMAKQKIDEEETANAKLKQAMAAMEETHVEERAVYDRRVADVRAAKRDAEAKRADAVAATSELQKALDAEKARAEKAQSDAEAALEHDERRVANLHAKLREAAKLEKEMEEKKNVAAEAARRLRQKLAEADRAQPASGAEAEQTDAAAKKPIAKVGAAEEGVAALALPPRRRPPTGAESQ